MTITKILEEVREFKPCSVSQLGRYLRKLEIKPNGGIAQRPPHYPEDSAKRILAALGFPQASGPTTTLDKFQKSVSGLSKAFPPNGAHSAGDGKVSSLTKLKSLREKSGRAKCTT